MTVDSIERFQVIAPTQPRAIRPSEPKRTSPNPRKQGTSVGGKADAIEPGTMKRMVAFTESSSNQSYVEPSPYAWLRTRAPVPTTYAPACDPLYPFQEILENRTSRARGMTGSCTEVVERKFSICIEIWQVELESCVWRVSFHKYAYVHGDPIQGIDPTGMFWQQLYLQYEFARVATGALAVATASILSLAFFHNARLNWEIEPPSLYVPRWEFRFFWQTAVGATVLAIGAEQAEKVAEHAWENHAEDFKDLGLLTKEMVVDYLRDLAEAGVKEAAGTLIKKGLENGGTAVWDLENDIILVWRVLKEAGTAFRPDNVGRYWKNLK